MTPTDQAKIEDLLMTMGSLVTEICERMMKLGDGPDDGKRIALELLVTCGALEGGAQHLLKEFESCDTN